MIIRIDKPIRLVVRFNNPTTNFCLYKNGKIYYQRDLKDKSIMQFNVNHIGTYTTQNDISKIEYLPRKKFTCYIDELPEPEKDIVKKPMYLIYNPKLEGTPARIDVSTGRVEYGKFYLSLPEPIQEYIILHEVGHNYYKTETYCDQYALKKFIDNYGNPSQAFYALAKVFRYPEYQMERIMNIYNNINH